MGWSQRGNGHTYDSLNGYCCLIGVQCGKILAYKTYNRLCRACSVNKKTGQDKSHDCRMNFMGSAKAMEGQGAKDLARNEIFKDIGIEIGGFVSDNDSQSLDSLQKVSAHPIFKQADMNHTKKGVKNKLYEIRGSKSRDPDSELSHDNIKYFVKCFSYAIQQNRGNLTDLSAALKNIPQHVMGKHDACGKWCLANKENYESSIVIENPTLLKEITNLFNQLSEVASKFLTAGSSQGNESVNNSICSKAPKKTTYSTTPSGDFRVAASVAQKNCYETYLIKVLDELKFSYTQRLVDYLEKNKVKLIKKHDSALQPEAKRKRIESTTKRSQLKYKNENSEGTVYESNMSLLSEVNLKAPIMETEDFTIIFYDLETGGLDILRHDILQICMKSGEKVFTSYITPHRVIDQRASDITHLTKVGNKLYKNGMEVETFPKKTVIKNMLDFIRSFEKKCLLVAHNDKFDAPRLLKAIKDCEWEIEFQNCIIGFSDSLDLFRKVFSDLNCHKLEYLATNKLQMSCDEAHDAIFDVIILEKLAAKFLDFKAISDARKTYEDVVNLLNKKKISRTLIPLEEEISKQMIDRLSRNGLSYDLIIDAFFNEGEEAVIKLLQANKNGKPTILKTKAVIMKIINHFKELSYILTN